MSNRCPVGTEETFRRGIMAKNFLEFIKLMNLQIQEAQGISSRINIRTSACINNS